MHPIETDARRHGVAHGDVIQIKRADVFNRNDVTERGCAIQIGAGGRHRQLELRIGYNLGRGIGGSMWSFDVPRVVMRPAVEAVGMLRLALECRVGAGCG